MLGLSSAVDAATRVPPSSGTPSAPASPLGVLLIARGSSDNAAIYGRYVVEYAVGRPVSLAAPSLHTLYDARVDCCSGYLAVAVSQSGRTPLIVSVLERVRSAGAVGLAVTNAADSPLALAAGAVLDLQAGKERAVPATKTYTATVAAFAALAEALGPVPWTEEDWEALPDAVGAVLADGAAPEAAARLIDDVRRAYGRPGVHVQHRARSGAEAEGDSVGPRRGLLGRRPAARADRGGAAGVPGRHFQRARARRGGRRRPGRAGALPRWAVITVSCDDGADLWLPASPAEPLAVIPAIVRGQQIALALTVQRGMDPDRPQGLTKVTPTT